MQIKHYEFVAEQDLLKMIIDDKFYHSNKLKYEVPFIKDNLSILLESCIKKTSKENLNYTYEIINDIGKIVCKLTIYRSTICGIEKWNYSVVLNEIDYKTFYIQYLVSNNLVKTTFDQFSYIRLDKNINYYVSKFQKFYSHSGTNVEQFNQLVNNLKNNFNQNEKEIVSVSLNITNISDAIQSNIEITIEITNYAKVWIVKSKNQQVIEWIVDDHNFKLSDTQCDIIQQVILMAETYKNNSSQIEIKASDYLVPYIQQLLLEFKNQNNKLDDIYKIISSNSISEIKPILTKRNLKHFIEEDSKCRCSICFSKYNIPTVLNCGHTFCKNCIDGLEKCSMCNQQITNKVRNYALDEFI